MVSANFVDLSTVLKTFCGKPQYIAQEVSGPVCFAVLSLTASRWTDGASVLSSTSYSALQQGQEDPAGAAIANSNS